MLPATNLSFITAAHDVNFDFQPLAINFGYFLSMSEVGIKT